MMIFQIKAKRLIAVFILAAGCSVGVSAELLAEYSFAAGQQGASSVAAGVSAENAAWVGLEGGFSRSQHNAYAVTSQTKGPFSAERYLTVSIKADSGFVINPETLTFELGGSRSGGSHDVVVNASVRSDVDGFAESLYLTPGLGSVATHTFNSTKPTFTRYTADLSEEAFQGRSQITFRIYVNSASGSSQIYLRINSIELLGEVASGVASKAPVKMLPPDRITESLNNPKPILSIAPLFTDNAVLQRGAPLPVWGRSLPGKKITVRFAGQTVSSVVGKDRRWTLELAPLKAEKNGRDFVIESDLGKVVLTNVVVGEVWLCSGQSNMEWPLKHDTKAEQRFRESDLPLIRQFKVKNIALEEPSEDANGAWILCSPETAGDFTAVGYYFARELQPKLDVPIGLINSSWGSTAIESWMSPEALDAFPHVAEGWQRTLSLLPERELEYQKELAEYKRKAADAKANGTEFNWRKYPKPPPGPGTKHQPAGPYNGMIAPLIPYSIAGILWYQGEANGGNAPEYAEFLPAHIRDLRQRWGQDELPFYLVQLPNYDWKYDRSGVKWAKFRDAQMEALALPNVGAAIIIDGPTPEEGHPPDKGYVGARLARLAAVKHYEIESGDASGPICIAADVEGANVTLRFDEATSGLKVKGNDLSGFELAGSDGSFHPAEARIQGATVVVSSGEVLLPTAVRYAWENNPKVSLYNGEGLPASPFSMNIQ